MMDVWYYNNITCNTIHGLDENSPVRSEVARSEVAFHISSILRLCLRSSSCYSTTNVSRSLYSRIVSSTMQKMAFVYPALVLCASVPSKKPLESTECITLGMSEGLGVNTG